MGELLRRGYEKTDAPALAELLNLIEVYGGGHAGYTADEMHTMVSTLVRDPAADTLMVLAPDVGLVAAATTAPPPEGGFRADLWGGVHPQWRGRGLGRELLGWQLARAGELRAAQAPDSGWEAHVGAVTGDKDAVRLFERFGMTPARYWFEMVASTADPPVTTVPDGLSVKPHSPEHENAVYAAHMEAFVDHWGYQRRSLDDWLALTVRSDGFAADLSLLAFDGAELAGYLLSYKDADPKRLYIGHVGVRRPWRRRGVASALLAQSLAAAADAGLTNAALGVDADSPTGAVGVYERAGFHIEYRAVTYSTPV